jgi:hypothetical protein
MIELFNLFSSFDYFVNLASIHNSYIAESRVVSTEKPNILRGLLPFPPPQSGLNTICNFIHSLVTGLLDQLYWNPSLYYTGGDKVNLSLSHRHT